MQEIEERDNGGLRGVVIWKAEGAGHNLGD